MTVTAVRRALAMVALLTALALVSAHAQRRPPVPLATDVDELLAQQSISADGKEITFRAVVADDVRICVEPRRGVFGARRCFTVGAIRRGDVREVRR
jgi:hypothetical protein